MAEIYANETEKKWTELVFPHIEQFQNVCKEIGIPYFWQCDIDKRAFIGSHDGKKKEVAEVRLLEDIAKENVVLDLHINERLKFLQITEIYFKYNSWYLTGPYSASFCGSTLNDALENAEKELGHHYIP